MRRVWVMGVAQYAPQEEFFQPHKGLPPCSQPLPPKSGGRARTGDLRVMSPALFQLSYPAPLSTPGAHPLPGTITWACVFSWR